MLRLLRSSWPHLSRAAVVGVGCLPLSAFAQTAPSSSTPPTSSSARPPAGSATTTTPAKAQGLETRPEWIVLNVLRSNPVTAPYPIATSWRSGQVVLSGRVGTKVVHDTAVQLAIGTGHSIRDDLKIDTAEVYRSAAMSPAVGAAPYYVYPPPLFGRIDDPFFGFEPPLLSYPAWWGAVAAREPVMLPPQGLPDQAAGGGQPGGAAPVKVPIGSSLEDGTIEMTLDTRGVATLRGTVPTLADRVAVGQKIMQTPGVTEVINLLNVGSSSTAPPQPQPPPPPQPENDLVPRRPERGEAPAPAVDQELRPAISSDTPELSERLSRTFLNRPALATLPIKVSVRDGVAYLSGQVPTAYEAMLAFRAAQQTPGIREVDDRLQFVVPDGERRNPLQLKGRPDDVEPYLTAQIRRQAGDIAHVDQVRLQGDRLEIKGTLLREDDRPRLDAILRSMPLLRGFKLESNFVVD